MARNKNIPSNNPAVKHSKKVAEDLDRLIRDGNYVSLLEEPSERIHRDEKFRKRADGIVRLALNLRMQVPGKLLDDLGLRDYEPPPDDDAEVENPKVPDEDFKGAPF